MFFVQAGQGICEVFILGIIQISTEYCTGQQVLADPIFSRRIRLEEVWCFPISATVYSRVPLDTITCKILRTGAIFGDLAKRSIQFDYPKKIPSSAELELWNLWECTDCWRMPMKFLSRPLQVLPVVNEGLASFSWLRAEFVRRERRAIISNAFCRFPYCKAILAK